MIPTGGGENDYQLVFTYQGTQYFTQLAVEQSGTVLAWDGQLVKVSLENKYLQEHLVTGTITPGPNGTAEVDAPISDFTGRGRRLHAPAAERSDLRARGREPGAARAGRLGRSDL